ncbi:hypothetical protein RUM43_003331 [Polyplax serrata]|uniref:DUF4550 domain-containing protein n=1 Tax=Polyplax serrata TaxID=468196 RepID=A0AAN8S6G4_POLSC
MVWFTFTFLLGLPKGSGGDDKPKKNVEKLQVDRNYVELDVSKPNFTCHIEYVLFPNDPPKRIDVACWDEVAKIYFENATSAIKPKVIQKLRWIHFRVNHEMKLSTPDVPIFHKHLVKVGVNLGNKKFGDLAKSDNTKKFYSPKFKEGEEHYIRQQYFQPVSETLADLEAVSYFKEHLTTKQQLYVSLDTTIETSENSDLLFRAIENLSKEYHDSSFVRVPSPPIPRPPSIRNILKSYEPVEEVPVEPKKGKEREKTVDKKKEAINDSIEFSIAGEDFLSGVKLFENCVKYNSQELPFLFSIVRIRKVLKKSQVEYFNPLSIKLNHCTNIPVETLKKQGVTLLKFRYLIFDEFLVESNLIPIAEGFKLNFSRTFLTNATDRSQFIYFLQTGGLKIELLGNLVKPKLIPPKTIFDVDELRCGTQKCRQQRPSAPSDTDEYVILGTAFVDVSSLLLQPHRLLFKCNVQIPPVGDSFLVKDTQTSDFITIYEFYGNHRKKVDLGLFSSSSPLSPVLTVSIQIGCPLTRLYQNVLMDPNLLSRLFAVIYEKDIAISIIQIIQHDTKKLLEPVNYCMNSYNIKRPLTRNNMGTVCSSESSSPTTQITGFFVESKNKSLVFVEGSPFGGIQQVWAVLSFLKPSQGHVLYDSSLVFTERLYQNFLKYGGFFKVNLQKDAEMIQTKPRRSGQVPIPEQAWKALTSLNMLIHCKSIKAASQNNLFPDSDSLSCLALEFGIPKQMCKQAC